MSKENVEIVREAYAAWNAGDTDTMRELFDPDITWRPPAGWPEQGPFVGREAVVRWFEQLLEVFTAYSTELVGDALETDDAVIVRQIWHGAGHGPDAAIEATSIITLRNGRIAGVEQFWDHAEALEAAGLSE